MLSTYKINHLQLYIEHTFSFLGHPSIGKDASPLLAEDILKLDAHALKHYIELVPSLACLGHMATVLMHPEYHHLAEDLGTGNYVTKQGIPAWGQGWKAWSLAPANPESYTFLDSLFAEFLPLFTSKRFNVCCDEAGDIGCGQSYKLAKRIGRGELYVRHLLKLYELCGKYDKKMMFWGDIIRAHPELVSKLPSDVTVLDWGYEYNHDYESIKDFQKAGRPFMACPSTSSYISFFPRIPQSRANVIGFTAAARKYGAQGVLNTEWGDCGHFNFIECSWSEILFGAEQSWNPNADDKNFSRRFAERFLGVPSAQALEVAKVFEKLGAISFLNAEGLKQSLLQYAFFATPGHRIFGAPPSL